MTWMIARKEGMETLRDGRLRWGVGVLLALLSLSLITGWRHYQAISAARMDAQTELRAQWLNRQANNAHIAAHGGTVLFRPYGPLTMMDKGIDAYVGTSVFLEAHRSNDLQHTSAARSSALQRLGETTAANVMQLLVPLLIILMSFHTFAGERESGTLRLVLSLGVPPRALLLGKALGTCLPLLLVLVPVSVLGALALAFHGAEGGMATSPQRVLATAAVYLAYFAVIAGLSVAVSARSATAQRALVVLLGFWVFSSFALPRIALDLGERAYPTALAPDAPNADAAEKAHAYSENYRRRMKQLETDMLAKYGVAKAADLPVSISALMLAASEEEDTRDQRAAFSKLHGKYAAQQRLYDWAGLLAPGMAVKSISAGLAGSDLTHFRHFAEAAEDYRFQTVQQLNDDLIHHPYSNAQAGTAAYRLREKALYESIAPFRYEVPDWRWAVGNVSLPLLVLAAWCIAVTAFTLRSVKQMQA